MPKSVRRKDEEQNVAKRIYLKKFTEKKTMQKKGNGMQIMDFNTGRERENAKHLKVKNIRVRSNPITALITLQMHQLHRATHYIINMCELVLCVVTLTAHHLSPLSKFKSLPRHRRKLPVIRVKPGSFTGILVRVLARISKMPVQNSNFKILPVQI